MPSAAKLALRSALSWVMQSVVERSATQLSQKQAGVEAMLQESHDTSNGCCCLGAELGLHSCLLGNLAQFLQSYGLLDYHGILRELDTI